MRVNNVQKNSFYGLTVSNKTLKACNITREQLLGNKNIRDTAEKYEVFVDIGQGVKKVEKDIIIRFGNMLLAGAFGNFAGLIAMHAMSSSNLYIMLTTTMAGIGAGAISLFSALSNPYKIFHNVSVQARKQINGNESNNITTGKYEVKYLSEIPDLVQIIESKK